MANQSPQRKGQNIQQMPSKYTTAAAANPIYGHMIPPKAGLGYSDGMGYPSYMEHKEMLDDSFDHRGDMLPSFKTANASLRKITMNTSKT